jgi:RNA-directed DNA polymerase
MPVERRALTSGATIRDRVAQTAATLVLEPIFEADMDPAAHGYRPGRSAGQAIQTVLALLRQGYTDGVDADLSQYFDTIPHDELMQSLASRQGVPQGGVISPLIANLYMNRFLKYWRQTGRGEAWQAHVINYADDFVILSRGHADEALAWTDRTMTRLGLTLNRTKTRLCDSRTARFDFLGYSFGQHRIRQTGRLFIGASPSNKSVQRLKDRVGEILVPDNMGIWDEVRTQLTRLMRGWGGYFSPGSHYVADRAIEAHVYDRVRNVLARRQKMPARSIGPFSMTAVFGHLGVPRMRHCRRPGVPS